MSWRNAAVLILIAIAASVCVYWLLDGVFTPVTIAMLAALPTVTILAIRSVRRYFVLRD